MLGHTCKDVDIEDTQFTNLHTMASWGKYGCLAFVGVLCLCALLPCKTVERTASWELHVAGLLPVTGTWPAGSAMLSAIQLALDHINDRRDVLPDYTLTLHFNDTQYKVYEGVEGLYNLLNSPPIKMAVLGAANSELTGTSAIIAKLYNLVCMSYASVSPALSDKATYPWLFRTSAPEVALDPARLQLIHEFGWRRVATLHHTFYNSANANFEGLLGAANIIILASETFSHDPTVQMHNLKNSDARIIFTLADENLAVIILCQAYRLGMYGARYTWFYPGWFDEFWWRKRDSSVACSPEGLLASAEGYISVTDVTLNPDLDPGIAGITSVEFMELYDRETNYSRPFGSHLVAQAYDAVWALALAFNATEAHLIASGSTKRLYNFSYEDVTMATSIYQELEATRFQGVKSNIAFDENQDPLVTVKIRRLQGGVMDTVGHYESDDNNSKIRWCNETPLDWPGGRPTPDSTAVVLYRIQVSRVAYYIMCGLAAAGMILAISFLTINIVYRKTKLIKMSSPTFNSLILLGCLVLYSHLTLLESDPAQMLVMCKIRVCTAEVGHSLVFGSLFSKTWRIHVVFANKQLKQRIVKDRHVLLMVVVMLLIDLSVLVLWQIIDQPFLATYNTTSEVIVGNGTETLVQRQVHVCESEHKIYFQGALYACDGLLLLFGAFLAWETRQVRIPALNDSRLIGLSVYTSVVLTLLTAVLDFNIVRQVEMHYILTSVIGTAGNTAIMCFIFIPKIIKLRESRVSAEVERAYTTNHNSGKQPTSTSAPAAGSSSSGATCEQSRMAELEERLAQALASLKQIQTQELHVEALRKNQAILNQAEIFDGQASAGP